MNDSKLTVTVVSFSYKLGLPADATGHGGGFVFDCRCVENPGRLAEFKSQTGIDRAVIDFLTARPEAMLFLNRTSELVLQAVNHYLGRGFTQLQVGFGCTGGQHRSVFFAEALTARLTTVAGVNVKLSHRDIPKGANR